ncbi:hypothetical protein [Geoglobus acetivorans]|uniref:Uncharacterized protein n=1 Tax=Geoglobus acetivorans TaxID=565033 RepID=A0A0A7GJG7_GEOAI|nr:hypothetical protein GACE_2083 [Geoglobus acetivorans]
MSAKILEKRRVRSWHGLEFEIVVWSNWWAKIGFMLHPQVANFMMRYSLPEDVRGKMEVLHEFGHVQMFPLVLIYYLPFLFLGIAGWWEFVIITAGMLLFWEVLAEAYVAMKFDGYFEVYRQNLHPVTAIYWVLIVTAVLLPAFAVIGRML